MGGPPTVLLIDDHELVRRGVRFVLESQDVQVVGEASLADAVAMASNVRPTHIVLDPDTGHGVSLDIIHELIEAAGDPRILILTDQRDPAICARSMMLGAVGIMYKHEPPEVLFKAIEKLHAGEVWLDRSKTATVLNHIARRRRDIESSDAKIDTLTRREREIVAAICEGLRNRELADRLCISEATVRNHVTSILDKLGLANRFDLVVFSFHHHLSTPRD